MGRRNKSTKGQDLIHMEIRADQDGFILSAGKSVYANQRLVSIPILELPDDDPLAFGEGYDGGIGVSKSGSGRNDLSFSEGIEMCDAMIKSWKKRRAKLVKLSKGS